MGSNDIYVMRSDGSDIRRLTKNSSNDNHPTWAYDNQTIAFLSDRTGATEIFTSRGTSVEPTQVTFDKARKSDPSWQKFLPIPNTGSAG